MIDEDIFLIVLNYCVKHKSNRQGVYNAIPSRADILYFLVSEGYFNNLLEARILGYDQFLSVSWKRNLIDFSLINGKQIPYIII